MLALVECRKTQGKEFGPDTALGRWVTWALQQADRIDPLAESPASVLDRKGELEGNKLLAAMRVMTCGEKSQHTK